MTVLDRAQARHGLRLDDQAAVARPPPERTPDPAAAGAGPTIIDIMRGWRLLRGLLPLPRARWAPDALAGVTLAMLAVPEVLGYARIAGMPVVTGLYTMLLPMVVFALLGSSRHLVVGADSATAAILAAGLVGLAAPGDPRYVQLAGTAAVLVAVLLLLARLIRLGFLANFLSRTVLVGFLTGVGIAGGGRPARRPARGRPRRRFHPGAAVAACWAGCRGCTGRRARGRGRGDRLGARGRALDRRIPAALLAVVGAIVAAHLIGLERFGVALLGPVPAGLPGLALPALAPPTCWPCCPSRCPCSW